MHAGRPSKFDAMWQFALGGLCFACVWPIFYVSYPPLGDLPQHLAAVRVLHDFSNPAFGFQRFFELDLLATQYLSYYLAAHALAYVFDVELANRLLIAASLVGLPYALRSLLNALGKDPRIAMLVLPLAYSAHLILGFLNFVAAIPLSLYGVSLAVQQRRGYSGGRALGLSLLSVLCFYTHVVPFALLALAVGLVSLARDWRVMLRSLAPLLPACAAGLLWMKVSPAGQATAVAASSSAQGIKPEFQSATAAFEQLPRWLTDVFAGGDDLVVLKAWGALLLLVFALAVTQRALGKTTPAPDALGRSLGLRLWVVPALCALLYFVLPVGYSWIWPISPRFPLLCAIWLVVVLPRFELARTVVLGAAVVLTAASFHIAGSAFARFEREEVGDFEQALQVLPARQRVVGLIFDRYSRNVAFAPFLHYVAYYQARKGGAVMFTFADFPQSPFRFKEEQRLARVPPRWEWLPERVRPAQLREYDYALVRGGPGIIARAESGFSAIYRGARWSVWRRRGAN